MIPFRTILVAADFSESSRGAFQVACALAREESTRVVVLNVMEPKYVPESPVYFGQQSVRYLPVARDASEHESLKRRLREIYVSDHPLDVEYQTREGETGAEILRSSEELGCDLIVMGTHGRSGLGRLLAGSIAETVLRKASCPVLALRGQEVPRRSEPILVILHPTDVSECSRASLHVARRLARDVGARLVVLHVTPVEVVLEGTLAGGGDPDADRDSLEEICEEMEGPDLKCPVETRLERGDPTAKILRVAGEIEADLIVMGTHGRSGLGRALMGSVAEAVLRRARCPVLITRSTPPEPPAACSESTLSAEYIL
jgi:nucleotide-binding universal stress UspA family protein